MRGGDRGAAARLQGHVRIAKGALQVRFDALHVVHNDRAGELAIGEKHGDDLRPADEFTQLYMFTLVRRPPGFSLVE